MAVLICVSTTEEGTARLLLNGPKRDFVELARATGGEIVHRTSQARRGGLLGRLFGPHLRQAWSVSRRVRDGDVIYADGEHIALPLMFFLAARRRRPQRIVFIGHVLWGWKRALLRAGSRLSRRGVLVVHSAEQAHIVRGSLSGEWTVRPLPYQVDIDFWRSDRLPDCGAAPLVLAVGSEHRDYRTLIAAVEGLPVRLLIAAGSHWARAIAEAGSRPENVELLTDPCPSRNCESDMSRPRPSSCRSRMSRISPASRRCSRR